MLQGFVSDFREDPYAKDVDVTFGIKVKEVGEWVVEMSAEELQANPFPSLFILIGGSMESRIGGKEMTLEGKQAILVPAGVPHEFWNNQEAPAEFILIMFGEGA